MTPERRAELKSYVSENYGPFLCDQEIELINDGDQQAERICELEQELAEVKFAVKAVLEPQLAAQQGQLERARAALRDITASGAPFGGERTYAKRVQAIGPGWP